MKRIIERMQPFYPWLDRFFGLKRTALLALFAWIAIGAEGILLPIPAHADPTCTFLGQNYPVQYDCMQNQPWLPYGTPGNPPNTGAYPGTNCALPMNQHNEGC
jgi:hypothetical protein